jgi:hypothetical protein
MDTPFNWLDNIANWPFLQEPLYRWALFFGALLGIAWGWNGIIDLMK